MLAISPEQVPQIFNKTTEPKYHNGLTKLRQTNELAIFNAYTLGQLPLTDEATKPGDSKKITETLFCYCPKIYFLAPDLNIFKIMGL